MALEIGSRLGHYDVTALIGEGGMGQVYRATDTTLDRNVALKVLPDAFTADPDRLARFEREAKVLASLNHPNIGAIYGLEKSGNTRALVLELIEGPTLADRIKRGPIPLDEALPIAKQIAEALEAAHEAGVIHRDLKPANIKVRDDGTVKVLDFGLAKALDPSSTGDPSQSPTLTAAATQMGVIMGTAAYMSPEQARGKPVDKRADIWAFGAVLFEMLTGQRAFEGEDVSVTLADVIRADVSWEKLPTDLPPGFATYLRRCLEKERNQRIQAIGDVRLAMEGAFEVETAPSAVVQPNVWQRSLPWAVTILLAAITGFALWSSERPAVQPSTRLTADLPLGVRVDVGPVISPDGRTVAFEGVRNGLGQIYLRSLSSLEAVPLRNTEGTMPESFSPNGQWLLVVDRELPSTLRRVPVAGGPATAIGEAPVGSVVWGPDDTLLIGDNRGLWSKLASGGERTLLVGHEESEAGYQYLSLLPDGRGVLYSTGLASGTAEVAVYDVGTDTVRTLLPGMAPTDVATGHMVFWREGSLWAVPFDPDRLTVSGTPVAVVEGVEIHVPQGGPNYAVGSDGTLVYIAAGEDVLEQRSLVWVDREGRSESANGNLRAYRSLRLSPDGQRVAVSAGDVNVDIWIDDLTQHMSNRFTFDPAFDLWPVWTPDGEHIVFTSGRDGAVDFFRKAVDGSGQVEQITSTDRMETAYGFTADGATLIMAQQGDDGSVDLGFLALDGHSDAQMLLESDLDDSYPTLSPDGRWLAYTSNQSGEREVWVRPFPNVADGQWPISREFATAPVWGPSGQELFYQTRTDSGDVRVMSVAIEPGSAFSAARMTQA